MATQNRILQVMADARQSGDFATADHMVKTLKEEFLISHTDARGIITSANDMFCKVSGYSREELLGSPHNIVRHPDTPKAVFAEMWSTIQAGRNLSTSLRHLAARL